MGAHYVFDERFVEAFAHGTHRVLGFRLRPFSLWHEFNLQLIDSPFLTGEVIRLRDLIAAVRICRSHYASDGTTPELSIPPWPRRLWWWWRLLRMQPLTVEVQRFGSYLEDFAAGPKFWPNQHKGGGDGDRDIDELLETAAWIWRQTGCGEAFAWNMPAGKARWYSAVFSKLEGADVQIWTPIHDELKKKNDRKREKLIADRTTELIKGIPASDGKEAIPPMAPEAAAKQAKDEYWARVKAFFAGQRGAAKPGPR